MAANRATTPPTTLLDYPDAPLRAMWRAMREPRTVEGSAIPPRHLDTSRFPETLVDRNEIVPGGPPPDGIPSIDDPRFVAVSDVDGLDADEAVLVLDHEGATKIYPVRIMIWHEIVNDEIAGEPVTVTYCPLCNSAIAYRSSVGDEVLDFGTTGYLFRSGLVMYDRQTESLWTHFDGRAVVGTLMGEQLDFLSVATVAWSQAAAAHPDARVLVSDADKPYGRNRYVGYERAERPLRGWFNVEIPEPIPPKARVIGVRTPTHQVAIPTDALAERRVVAGTVGGRPFVAFWTPGTASPLDRADITAGDDVGSTGVFDPRLDGRALGFVAVGEGFVDDLTGSRWDIRGQAIAGPLAGAELAELEHLDTFWFAWVGHHPSTELLLAAEPPGGAGAAPGVD